MPRVTLPVSDKGGTGMTFWAGGHSSEPHCPYGHPRLPFSTPTQGLLANAWVPSQPSGPLHCCSTCLAHPSWECPAWKTLPLPGEVEAALLAPLDRVRGFIFGSCYTVECMCLSLHLISGSQRAEICSCSSPYPCTRHRAWCRASFQSMLLH